MLLILSLGGTMPDSSISQRLASLPTLSKPALCELWHQLFKREPPPVIRKNLLLRIVAHRLQELEFGGLSDAACRRLRRLATAFEANPNAAVSTRPRIKPGILQNPIYLGEIHHRGMNHPGEHAPIVPRELWDRAQAQLKSDNQGRRNGLKANSPSLLVGLMRDAEGNRFTPSHTLKNGRRYRYYVCQTTMDGREAPGKPARVPAQELEQQICRRVQSFLQSGKDIMDELSLPEDPPARTQQIMAAAAAKQSDHLRSASPSAMHDFVRRVVRRVVVHADRIEVEVGKRELLAALDSAPPASSSRPATQQLQGSSEVIHLDIEARVKRCGGEMRLVFPPDHHGQAPSHPASSLLKALARGRTWHEWIVAGEVSGRRSIAQKLGLDERYVGRVLECAFLAPDIMETMLDGRQPSDLTFKKLTRGLPLSWMEQRKQLGFPPPHPRQ
jgi:hypothetical protein